MKEGRAVADLVGDLAEQLHRRAPDDHVVVDAEETQRYEQGFRAVFGNAEVFLEFVRPLESGAFGSFDDDAAGVQLHFGCGGAQAPIGVEDGIAQERSRLKILI